jgi:hypothetical protein
MKRSRSILAAALLALVAGAAWSHHIIGIPHYAYDENYPQLPFVEIVATSGPWDIRMSYMPGIIEPGQRVRFKLYAVHRETREPLRKDLVGQVRRLRFGGSPEPVAPAFPIRVGKGPEGNDYKFFHEFPSYDAFEVLVRFEFPDGAVEEIPFPVTVGVTDDTPVLGGAILLVFFAAVVVRYLKGRDQDDA